MIGKDGGNIYVSHLTQACQAKHTKADKFGTCSIISNSHSTTKPVLLVCQILDRY